MKRNKEPIGCGFFGFALDIPFFFSWPLCIDWVHTNSLAPLDLSPPLVAPWSARTRRKKGLNLLEWDDPVGTSCQTGSVQKSEKHRALQVKGIGVLWFPEIWMIRWDWRWGISTNHLSETLILMHLTMCSGVAWSKLHCHLRILWSHTSNLSYTQTPSSISCELKRYFTKLQFPQVKKFMNKIWINQ